MKIWEPWTGTRADHTPRLPGSHPQPGVQPGWPSSGRRRCRCRGLGLGRPADPRGEAPRGRLPGAASASSYAKLRESVKTSLEQLRRDSRIDEPTRARSLDACRRLAGTALPTILNNLAWGLALSPNSTEEDRKRALRLARRAVEQTPDSRYPPQHPRSRPLPERALRRGPRDPAPLPQDERQSAGTGRGQRCPVPGDVGLPPRQARGGKPGPGTGPPTEGRFRQFGLRVRANSWPRLVPS